MNLNKFPFVSLKKINFGNFSQSECWVGYYQANNLQDDSLIYQSTELVTQFFGEDLDHFFMISALALNEDIQFIAETTEIDKLYGEKLKLAFAKGFIQPYNQDFIDHFENDTELPANLLTFHFESQDFMPFCEVLMAYYFGKIHGQICFLINPKLQIALYPHDDIGFGCISLNNDKTVLTEFLKFCDSYPNFSTHINQ